MTLPRRTFLRLATLGRAYCLAAGRASAAEAGHSAAAGGPPHWSYEGKTGPEHWGELQSDFEVCQLGLDQTPIDLAGGIMGEGRKPVMDYKPLPLRVVNRANMNLNISVAD